MCVPEKRCEVLILPDLCVLAATGSHNVLPSLSPSTADLFCPVLQEISQTRRHGAKRADPETGAQPETSVNRMGER